MNIAFCKVGIFLILLIIKHGVENALHFLLVGAVADGLGFQVKLTQRCDKWVTQMNDRQLSVWGPETTSLTQFEYCKNFSTSDIINDVRNSTRVPEILTPPGHFYIPHLLTMTFDYN